MTINITKELIGKRVWLVPTGNNIQRNGTTPFEQVKEAEIIKMARTKGSLKLIDSSYSRDFSISEYSKSSIKQGFNAGYDTYASLDDVKKTQKATDVRTYLCKEFNSISDEDLLEIGIILNL